MAEMDFPPVPHDIALYPTLVWPYDGPPAGISRLNASPDSLLAVTPASSNVVEADALLTLASGIERSFTGQSPHPTPTSPALSGQGAPFTAAANNKPDGGAEMNLANIMSGTQQFNDDVLWQMVFGSTTQVGIEGLTGQVVSATS